MGTSKSTNSLKKTDEFQSQIEWLVNTSNNECQSKIGDLKAINHNYSNNSASEIYGNKRASNTSKVKQTKIAYQHENILQRSDWKSKSTNSSRSRDRRNRRDSSISELKGELAQMHSYYKKKLEAERERYEHVSSSLHAQVEKAEELDKFCWDLQKQLMLKDNQINELKAKFDSLSGSFQYSNVNRQRIQEWE